MRNQATNGKFDECRDCVCDALRRASRDVTLFYQRYFRGTGVRATQFAVLAMLARSEATALTLLARDLGLERTTLSRNLAVLEEKGWVRSVFDNRDQRLRKLELTAKGRVVAEDALFGWRKAQAGVAKMLDHHGIRIGPKANWKK